MKELRQKMILELIAKYNIDTQEELMRHLAANGFRVTQATVSRDITDLKIVKGASSTGGYRYVRATDGSGKELPKFNSALYESIVRMDHSGNNIVIKTFPGMAQAVAACIDSVLELSFNICVVSGGKV